MTLLLRLADLVLNRPLLITPEKAQIILSVLAGRLGVNAPDASRFEGDNLDRDEQGRLKLDAFGNPKLKPYRTTESGVGIITVTGSLVNRGAWVGASSGLTSYEGIGHQLKTALADDKVKSVILDLHSPGGEAVGAFETAALVRDLAATKRTVAVVNGMAASAAYAIASGASEIVTTETGISGSIGVVMLHADFSRALANEGIEPTLIFAGAHKVDGNPYEPLSAEVQQNLQAEVNALYDAFAKTVGKGRGNRLTAAAARRTEAKIFIGSAAVEAGVADRVGSFDSVLAELSRAQGGRATSQPGRKSMSETTGGPAATTNAGISQADHDAAVAAARTAGAAAERERFAAIFGAEGVKGDAARMTAAFELATKAQAMAAADVVAFVSANVAQAKPVKPAASLPERAAAATDPLAGTDQPSADASAKGWSKAISNANRRFEQAR